MIQRNHDSVNAGQTAPAHQRNIENLVRNITESIDLVTTTKKRQIAEARLQMARMSLNELRARYPRHDALDLEIAVANLEKDYLTRKYLILAEEAIAKAHRSKTIETIRKHMAVAMKHVSDGLNDPQTDKARLKAFNSTGLTQANHPDLLQ